MLTFFHVIKRRFQCAERGKLNKYFMERSLYPDVYDSHKE